MVATSAKTSAAETRKHPEMNSREKATFFYKVPSKSFETRVVFSAFNTASYGLTYPQYFCDNSRSSYCIFNFKTRFYWEKNELSPWFAKS